jgi:hypothetical protein
LTMRKVRILPFKLGSKRQPLALPGWSPKVIPKHAV